MVRRTFIYGEFLGAEFFSDSAYGLAPPPRPELATEAIEILREFSLLEFVGKIYVLTPSRNYEPVTPLGVRNYTWYRDYQMASLGKEKGKSKYYFKVKQGDIWRVLWIRQESDDAGPYMAVALQHDA
jgi:hypothetical protein